MCGRSSGQTAYVFSFGAIADFAAPARMTGESRSVRQRASIKRTSRQYYKYRPFFAVPRNLNGRQQNFAFALRRTRVAASLHQLYEWLTSFSGGRDGRLWDFTDDKYAGRGGRIGQSVQYCRGIQGIDGRQRAAHP